MAELSIVCPMFNEEAGIASSVAALVAVMPKLGISAELVLVDDGSTDRTRLVAEQALGGLGEIVSYASNRGRGHALRAGFARSRGRYVIATEADLSWGTDVFAELLKPLLEQRADVTIASPYAPGGRVEGVPCSRAWLSRSGNALLGRKFGVTMATGMTRGYSRSALDSLRLTADDKDLHVQILSEARRNALRVIEVPAVLRWAADRSGRGSLRWRHITSHLGWAFR